MKKNVQPSPMCPRIRAFGLVLSLSIYLLLSAFSVYELVHLSEILPSSCMRWKLTIAFTAAVLVPIYLVYIENSVVIVALKIGLEITPIAILIIFYCVSVSTIFSRTCMADLSTILITDIIASLILLLFEKLKHAKCN